MTCCENLNKAVSSQILYRDFEGVYLTGLNGTDDYGNYWEIKYMEKLNFCPWCGNKIVK